MGHPRRVAAALNIARAVICLVLLAGCTSNTMVPDPPTPAPTPTPTPPAASTANFLYTAGAGTGGPAAGVIATFKINTQTNALTGISGSGFQVSFAQGVIPLQGILTDTDRKFLFAAFTGGQPGISMDVASYLRHTDGSLTTATFSNLPNLTPQALAIDPLNRFFYIARLDSVSGASAITVMRIDATSGALSLASTFPILPATAAVTGLAADASGSFLYAVLDDGPGGASSIAELAVHSDGTLAQNGTAPVPGVTFLQQALANSTNLYVGRVTGGVYAFSITPGTGLLTQLGSSPFATNTEQVLAFFQTGSFLYVGTHSKRTPGPGGSLLLDPATIFAFQVQAGGALTPIAGSPFQPAFDSRCFTLGGNSFLYVGDGENIQGFSIDTATGKLTSKFTTDNFSTNLGCVTGP